MSDSWDISSVTRSSSTSDWANVTPANVEIIDEIVARIPDDAGIPAVLNVYSDVLRTRGIDPNNDVVIYRHMLQLGRLKGSWREKWESVKASLDHHTSSSLGAKTPPPPPPPAISNRDWNPRAASPTPRPTRRPISAPVPTPSARGPATTSRRPPAPPLKEPPGKRQVVQDARKKLQQLLRPQHVEEAAPIPQSAKGKGRAVERPEPEPAPVAVPSSSRHADAWKIAQDEKAAEVFRETVLLEKCWRLWRASLYWTRTTGEQVDAARQQLVAHKCLRYWHKSYLRQQGLMERATQVRENNVRRDGRSGKTSFWDARMTRDCMQWWLAKLQRKRAMEVHADAFARHHATPLARAALSHWLTKTRNRQRIEVFSAEYHAAQLTIRTFARWDRALGARLQAEHQATQLYKQFLARRFFRRWKEAVTKRRLKAAWRQTKRRHTQKWFERWLHLARMNRVSRVLGERSTMRSALSHWIGRVVELKERELVTREHADRLLVTKLFDRWRSKYDKLQDDISLLENIVLIRQQNEVRSIFGQWYNSMRRRRYLAQAEEVVANTVAMTTVCTVWEKWREKFLEHRLEPLERQFELQMQTNLRFLFFSRWYAKTLTLPAIHFRVTHLKEKAWGKWRAAMTPALQMKKARELDRRSVLIRAFEKWQAAYKETMARKARASQWRKLAPDSSRPSLPSTSPFAPRTPGLRFPQLSTPVSDYRSPFPRRPLRSPSPSRPPLSIPLRPSLSEHLAERTPGRPRSMTVESTSSPAPALTPTAISRPRSGFGGIGSSVTASSDADGKLWKQLRGERGLLRGARSDSRGGSPAPS
ncbi:hypothetical protein AURDEDRAFT_180610 [Auricularia subglabra TFB-10046 SS5]|nr:hypothetical protein AURDEDRAFT_180610 [Auricularia subglabra TFB-10046 SS5]